MATYPTKPAPSNNNKPVPFGGKQAPNFGKPTSNPIEAAADKKAAAMAALKQRLK